MPRIIVLDDNTINRIAAGEVVERPASVVKELVENAIDACASQINVEIEDGGAALIRVTDDGCGMEAPEVALALERHATSKIRCIEDVSRAGTLGFRGEALPSIASVSKLEITSRSRSGFGAYRIATEGGRVLVSEETGAPEGTSVVVRDLFFNTPARRKFLKSRARETALAVDAALREALSVPHIRFRVIVDGKESFATPGGTLFDAIVSVYGSEFARGLLEVSGAQGNIEISGYVGKPSLNRSSRSEQYIMVNGRSIRDGGIRWALEDAYSGSIPSGRYPVAFLNVKVDPESVDVNVHPAKTEVRFQDDRAVRSCVLSTVSRTVLGSLVAVTAAGTEASGLRAWGAGFERQATLYSQHASSSGAAGALAGQGSAFGSASGGASREWVGDASAPVYSQMPGLVDSIRERPPQQGFEISTLQPVGQVLGIYIVAEHASGLVLIDQHAAHERVNYEAIRSAMGRGERLVQPLIVPSPVALSPVQRAVLREYRTSFEKMGFDLEDFGGDSVLVRSQVSIMGVEIGFLPILDGLCLDRPVARDEAWPGERAAAALAACVASVKANQHLDLDGQRALIASLSRCDTPLVCPHGRPTVILYPREDIERRFGRR